MSVPTQSEEQKSPSYLEALTVYLRPSVLVIVLLGFSSGLASVFVSDLESGVDFSCAMAGVRNPPARAVFAVFVSRERRVSMIALI